MARALSLLQAGNGAWDLGCARRHGTACSWPRTSHSTRLLKPTRTLIVGHIKTGVSQVCVQSGTLHTAFFGVPILIIFDFLIFSSFLLHVTRKYVCTGLFLVKITCLCTTDAVSLSVNSEVVAI